MSVEEKIRRAEEIYNRRKMGTTNNISTTRVNVNSGKDFKILKKMIWQIIICLTIYGIYYSIINNNYIFSEDVINKSKEILAYDIDFNKIYNECINYINKFTDNSKEDVSKDEIIETNEEQNNNDSNENMTNVQTNDVSEQEENIGGADNSQQDNQNASQNNLETSQEEQDISDIKNKVNFIMPLEGTISSKFGWRNPTTSQVPKYHTGIDIAANEGTIIKSATDGEVSLASSEGDYRKPLKNSKWRFNFNICTL